jgi:hypothetical protein
MDELAHANVPGSRHATRWQDAGELLQAGIDVGSTVDVRQLDSLRDVVEKITGHPLGQAGRSRAGRLVPRREPIRAARAGPALAGRHAG